MAGFGLMLRVELPMDPLTLILVAAVVVLVLVALAQRRTQMTLVTRLEAERARAIERTASETRLLEEARSRAQSEQEEVGEEHERTNDLRDKLERAARSSNELRTELENAKRSADELTQKLDETRAQAVNLETKVDAEKRQTDDLRQQLDRANELGDSLRGERDTGAHKNEALRSEVEQQRKQSALYRDELEKTTHTVRRFEAESSALRTEIEDLRGLLEQARSASMADVGEGRRLVEALQMEVQTLRVKSETVTKELDELRAKADTRIRELVQAMRRAEEDVSTAQMQKDSFAGEVRALRDELERRKRLAEAESKAPAVSKVRPSKPPEPIMTYYCLVCGEGGAGPKPHRCMVEELEQQKKSAMKR